MELSVELKFQEMMDDAFLDRLAEDGVTAISAPYALIESMPKRVLKQRAQALKARGMRVDTAHPNFGGYNSRDSLVNQYILPRGLYLEQLKDGLERLSIFGARVAPLHTGGCCLAQAPEWSLELCAASVMEIEPVARETGILLVLENTFFHVPQTWDGGTNERPLDAEGVQYDDVSKLCRLIDQCASAYVKGCFDAGHAHYLGDLTGDHQMMGERIALYHLHDNDRTKDMHLPPGHGTLDWKALGGILREEAMPFYIEAAPWAQDSYGDLIRNTRALLTQ